MIKAGLTWCGERGVDSSPELDAESDNEMVAGVKATDSWGATYRAIEVRNVDGAKKLSLSLSAYG